MLNATQINDFNSGRLKHQPLANGPDRLQVEMGEYGARHRDSTAHMRHVTKVNVTETGAGERHGAANVGDVAKVHRIKSVGGGRHVAANPHDTTEIELSEKGEVEVDAAAYFSQRSKVD